MYEPDSTEAETMPFRVMLIKNRNNSDPAMARARVSIGFSVTPIEDVTTAYRNLLEVRPDVVVVKADSPWRSRKLRSPCS